MSRTIGIETETRTRRSIRKTRLRRSVNRADNWTILILELQCSLNAKMVRATLLIAVCPGVGYKKTLSTDDSRAASDDDNQDEDRSSGISPRAEASLSYASRPRDFSRERRDGSDGDEEEDDMRDSLNGGHPQTRRFEDDNDGAAVFVSPLLANSAND